MSDCSRAALSLRHAAFALLAPSIMVINDAFIMCATIVGTVLLQGSSGRGHCCAAWVRPTHSVHYSRFGVSLCLSEGVNVA